MPIVTRHVQMKLTAEERETRVQQLAEAIKAHDFTKEQAKIKAAGFKRDLDDYNARIRTLNHAIDTWAEDREVECYEEPDAVRQVVHIRRCDTHEIVDDREMTDAERQRNLFPKASRNN